MLKSIKFTFALAAFFSLFLVGCVEDIKESQEETQKAVEEIYVAQSAFSAAYDNTDELAQQEDDLNGFNGGGVDSDDRSCASTSLELTPIVFFPATLTVDYGDNCPIGGHNLAGKVIATFDGYLFTEGQTMSIEFDGYVSDGNKVEGKYVASNLGKNSGGERMHRHEIQNGKLVSEANATFYYEGQTTSTMKEGQETNWITNGNEGLLDDVWEEEETGTYINSAGNTYVLKTLVPRKKLMTCEFPVSGVVEISGDALNNPIEIDFGDGTCDRKVTVTTGLLSFEMDL